MSKHIRSSGLRAAFEQIFAGVAFAAVVAVIFAGTAAMCSRPRRLGDRPELSILHGWPSPWAKLINAVRLSTAQWVEDH